MNKVNKHKLEKVKRGLLQNKSYSEVLREAGYSEGRVKRGKAEPSIREALRQNETALAKKGLTPEAVIEELQWGIKESKLLKNPKDRLQLHSTYSNIIARHRLSTHSEVTGDFAPPPVFYNKIEVKPQHIDKPGKLEQSISNRTDNKIPKLNDASKI